MRVNDIRLFGYHKGWQKSRYWNSCPILFQSIANPFFCGFRQMAPLPLTFVCSTHLLPCLKCGMSSSLHLVIFYYILLFISIKQLEKRTEFVADMPKK